MEIWLKLLRVIGGLYYSTWSYSLYSHMQYSPYQAVKSI
uniref:Uncharacterized protein n=1 Tax=Arundo donax TaxID=35708 RepID=A0A0A9HAY4_ARUDO